MLHIAQTIRLVPGFASEGVCEGLRPSALRPSIVRILFLVYLTYTIAYTT